MSIDCCGDEAGEEELELQVSEYIEQLIADYLIETGDQSGSHLCRLYSKATQ